MTFMPKTALLAFLGASLLAPALASGQSFNCHQATTPTEHAICDSRNLSNLDVEMATLYKVVKELPMMMGQRGATEDDAKQFLQDRNACGANRSCLHEQYRKRIHALNKTVSDAMGEYCKAIQLC